MWVAGELVHVEDLVLHDSRMDVRAPTHELVIAHTILRSRRRIATATPGWALSTVGTSTLRGRSAADPAPRGTGEGTSPAHRVDSEAAAEGSGEANPDFAEIDAVLARAADLLLLHKDASEKPVSKGERNPLIYDADSQEEDLFAQWRVGLDEVADYPPSLAAAFLWESWEHLAPLARQNWLGALLTAAYLRSCGKVGTHLLAFNVGLRTVPRESRRASNRGERLLATLAAVEAAAVSGMRELDRLMHAKEQFERRLRNRRASSHLPVVLELALSRPIISAPMVAKAAKVSSRGALNLIGELGMREITGRGRYRAWGLV